MIKRLFAGAVVFAMVIAIVLLVRRVQELEQAVTTLQNPALTATNPLAVKLGEQAEENQATNGVFRLIETDLEQDIRRAPSRSEVGVPWSVERAMMIDAAGVPWNAQRFGAPASQPGTQSIRVEVSGELAPTIDVPTEMIRDLPAPR